VSRLESFFGTEASILSDEQFQLLLLVNLFPVMGLSYLSPILNSLIEPLGASVENIGLVISLFTLPAIFVIPIAGLVADAIGRKPIIFVSLLVLGISGVLIAFTTEYKLVLLLRFLQGIGFGGLLPIVITSIGDLYSGSTEATAQGFRLAVSGVSSTIFPVLAGFLVVLSWRYPFIIYLLAVPVAVSFLLLYEEPISTSVSMTDLRLDSLTSSSELVRYVGELRALLMQSHVLALVVARTLPNVIWTAFLTYNSIIVIQLSGGSPSHAGLLVAAGSVTYAFSASQAGRVALLFGNRFIPLLLSSTSLMIGFVIILLVSRIGIVTVGVVIMAVGFGLSLALYRSVITSIPSTDHRGGVVSIAEAGGQITNTLTPIVLGLGLSVLTPRLAFETALRVVCLTAALVAGFGGVTCIISSRDLLNTQ
jgi:MFS family permease